MAFTADQIAQLSAPLDRKHVKSRQQAGRNLSYIEGWHAIAEANRIFGFDAWDRETADLRCVVERETKLRSGADAWRVSYICKVQVRVYTQTPRENGDPGLNVDHTTREGTGYGSGIDQDLGAAHESAVKEAETDAMKRALMTFGNPFGLALYDKTQAEVSDGKEVVPHTVRPNKGTQQHNTQPPSHVTAGAGVPPKETAAQRIVREINEAKYPTTISTILAGNQSKFARWSETPEGEAVVQGINERANARLAELGA